MWKEIALDMVNYIALAIIFVMVLYMGGKK